MDHLTPKNKRELVLDQLAKGLYLVLLTRQP